MNISFIVHHPPIVHIAIQGNGTIYATFFVFFNIIPRKISVFPIVMTISVEIIKRRQIIILTLCYIAMRWPFLDDFRYFIVRKKSALSICSILLICDACFKPRIEFTNHILCGYKMLVVLTAIFVVCFCRYFSKRPCPIILSVSVTKSGKF